MEADDREQEIGVKVCLTHHEYSMILSVNIVMYRGAFYVNGI
jgi:hypothetical protein